MRIEKKYRVVPSPLVSIKWWRICLDEAQRIETPTAASAKMALNLTAQNKWCVSGTPIGRGKMDDLYGLYLFLNAKPFCYQNCFKMYLKPQYRDISDRIKHATYDLLWRSTKANEAVRKQMGIPEQIEKKVVLNFSSVERHFYKVQYEKTVLAVSAATSGKRSRPRKKDVEELTVHLHRLRAACCHPQVGSSGISKVAKGKTKAQQSSTINGVLNMAQILDRLIDDAKLKAEEAQRIFTLHKNALASLSNLKAEACVSGRISSNETEDYLLRKCCDHYFEALNEADKNSCPSPLVGEAILSGCNGFQHTNNVVRDGSATLLWRVRHDESGSLNEDEVWAKFEFTVSTKKISSILVRHKCYEGESHLNDDSTKKLYPKDCVLQVSNAAMGGAFVDAIPFTLACPNNGIGQDNDYLEWHEFNGLRPNKSKSWRVLVKTFHLNSSTRIIYDSNTSIFVGMEIQLLEPDIYSDNLQRMHILHNISLSLNSLSNKVKGAQNNVETGQADNNDTMYSKSNIQQKLEEMKQEAKRLESHYIEAARMIQQVSNLRLKENTNKRNGILSELLSLTIGKTGSKQQWSVDLLTWCNLYGNSQLQESLCSHIERRLFEMFDNPTQTFRRRSFPEFHNIDGLNLALNMRLQNEGEFYNELKMPPCMLEVEKLSEHPSDFEVLENSQCRKCRADWDQKGW